MQISTGVDRLEMSFDGKSYVHGQHRQLLMMKDKYDTNKYIDTYIYREHDVMFTKMLAKRESNSLETSSCGYIQRVPTTE